MSYLLYNILLTIGFVAVLPFAPFLLLLGPRYREGFGQRFAFYKNPLNLPLGADPIWIHAASVGEVQAAGALVRALKREIPERIVVISTFTATGNRIARTAGDADRVIFLPLDFNWAVRRTLNKIHPRLLIFIETEIWPNLLREAHRRGIPTIMLSGRLSAKSLSGYELWRSFFHRVLEQYTAMGMQSDEDAARIIKLGAGEKKVSVVGSLKFAVAATPEETHSPRGCGERTRPIFVAGSSHRGEEEILLQALQLARARCPGIVMVLAPRHPERFGEVEKLLKRSRFTFQCRTTVAEKEYFQKDILLLDTIGELPQFFKMADVAFVGGSLVNSGGHNLLEPARHHKPVLFGPYTSNFKSIAEEMKERGAAIEVHGEEDLARVLVALIADPQTRCRMGRSAAEFAAGHQEALTRNLRLAKQYL